MFTRTKDAIDSVRRSANAHELTAEEIRLGLNDLRLATDAVTTAARSAVVIAPAVAVLGAAAVIALLVAAIAISRAGSR